MAGLGLTKEAFIAHVTGAMNEPRGDQRKKLYFELLQCFTDADKDFDGSISPIEFDAMIEEAAAMPREHGLAPLTSQMYKTPEERLKGRNAMFNSIDENKDGGISLDEWLAFCYNHIGQKVKGLKA